jgi:hypothetical protein
MPRIHWAIDVHHWVDTADFESLILVANRSPRFLVLSPLELTDRRAQGIALCKQGYVSLYSINVSKNCLKGIIELKQPS